MNTSGDPRSVTEVDELIGERIRSRRQELGLPMAFVADEIGVAYQQLQKYETGENRISVAALTRIAEVLKVEPADLIPSRAGKVRRLRSAASTAEEGMTMQLQQAFARIKSGQERRLILDLAKRLADGPAPAKRAAPKKKGRR